MMSHFPLQRHGFDGQTYTSPGSLCGRGWLRPLLKGFSRINKINEKIIYFYCLSVDDNNCSPTVGNTDKMALITVGGPP
jgi:hypothetical protein